MSVKQTYFMLDRALYVLCTEHGFIHLKCTTEVVSNTPLLSSFDKHIKVSNIISTTYEKEKWGVDESSEYDYKALFMILQQKLCHCFAFKIHYWIKLPNHCRKFKTIKLFTHQEKNCMNLNKFIQKELSLYMEQNAVVRPRNLLMFINPHSGKKEAKSIYEQIASPLLDKANVKRTVILTTHKNHAKEYVESNDISAYDGIVTISGDGTLSEIVNSVLVAEQKKQNILLDGESGALSKPAKYAKAPIKFGIIPGGSTNSLNMSSQGTTDPETATLQIICGESHPLDVSSIHDDQGHFLTFFLLTSVYGHPSEFHKLKEKMRSIGPLRVLIALLLSFLKLKSYSYEIRYLLDSCGSPKIDLCADTTKCVYPCTTCHSEPQLCSQSHLSGDEQVNLRSSVNEEAKHLFEKSDQTWKALYGNLISTTLMNTTCKFPECPNGPSPSAHLADGCIDFVVVEKVPFLSYLEFLRAIPDVKKNHFAFPFVKCHRVNAIHFHISSDDEVSAQYREKNMNNTVFIKPSQSSLFQPENENCSSVGRLCNWSVDGDRKFDNSNMTLWVHRGLINIFSRGFEDDLSLETPV